MSTVQVSFTADEDYTMIFGDSYKTWRDQLQEYIWMLKNHKVSFSINDLHLSHSRFIQTGLKWCKIEEYEDELRAVGDKRSLEDFNWKEIDLPKTIEV